jgi:uncharacterized MAPEG superfamily protein
MTPDLWMLAAAVALTWAQIMLAATPSVLFSREWAFGNRDGKIERAPWVARADRAAQNMKENLPLFTALVLLAHVSGESDASSALGAQLFVGARVLHGAVYLAGIPYLRTLLWAVSVAGMLLIESSLF